MKATRDVAIDLLPLYVAGEASPDSRALVDEFLRQDPEVQAVARALSEETTTAPTSKVPDEPARVALASTRALLRRRTRLLAAAIFFTALPLSFVFGQHGLTFLLIRDAPLAGSALLAVAAGLWVGYGTVVHRMRVTGL